MSYEHANQLLQPMLLHKPPANSFLATFIEQTSQNKHGQVQQHLNIDFNNSSMNSQSNSVKFQPENIYCYRLVWKALHYIANFFNPFSNETKEAEIAYIVFVQSIAQLLPNKEYSKHMERFMNENDIRQCKTPNDKFKWTYRLHSYINFFKFMKNLRVLAAVFPTQQIQKSFHNFCQSLNYDKNQSLRCYKYVQEQIEFARKNPISHNDIPPNLTLSNLTYDEALKLYTPSDTNLITKNDWGPAVWTTIHFLAANIQQPGMSQTELANRYEIFHNFIVSLAYLLPCEICRNHMRENLNSPQGKMDFTRKSPFQWSCEFHNVVNNQNKKPEVKCNQELLKRYLVSTNLVDDKYEEIYPLTLPPSNNNLY